MPTGGISVLVTAMLLGSCIYLPRTQTTYDTECQVESKHMVLERHQVAAFTGCRNEGCLALLVASGVVTAASAVVSGSIATVGNVVYWVERLGQCVR